MEKKLDFFYIGDSYGGNQDWCFDHMMQLGGCAAVTACDSSIFFALHHGKRSLYRGNLEKMEKDEYLYFTEEMKDYLHPRWSGIDKPALFVEGYTHFLKNRGENGIGMEIFPGDGEEAEARKKIIAQIEQTLPVPILILNHNDPKMEDYVWHWFLLIGYRYEETAGNEEDSFSVQAVTYSKANWVNFHRLWNTGKDVKGGLILYSLS